MTSPLGLPAECTGFTARWCPVHGDCTCPHDEPPEFHLAPPLNDPRCPLHGIAASHPTYPIGGPVV